jgi:hypothetical protein
MKTHPNDDHSQSKSRAVALLASVAAGIAFAAILGRGKSQRRGGWNSLLAGIGCGLQAFPAACRLSDAFTSHWMHNDSSGLRKAHARSPKRRI